MKVLVPLLLLVVACNAQATATPETTTSTTTTTLPTTTTTSVPVEFAEPVSLTAHNDTIWVVERGGRIVSTDGEELINLGIDFPEDSKPETGLLSVEFWKGGYWVYVAWPATGISELWSMPYGANGLNDGKLLREWGPAPWHFAGHMEFHDPWLYISIGDGAPGASHADEAQQLRPDRGAILKYHTGEGRWEPAASGLRNPWTWTLNNGTFYIGDVGAQDAEEINIAPEKPYPNFGWPIYEGSECVVDGCEAGGHTPPAIEYRNDGGNAVVLGGLVDGELVWTDFFTGIIHYTNPETLETRTVGTDYMPTSLLVHDGEVWVASIDGRVGTLNP